MSLSRVFRVIRRHESSATLQVISARGMTEVSDINLEAEAMLALPHGSVTMWLKTKQLNQRKKLNLGLKLTAMWGSDATEDVAGKRIAHTCGHVPYLP